MDRWRLIDLEYDDPSMNLAVEESIARSVGKGLSPVTLRFWKNAKRVVIVGRHQSTDQAVNLNACRKHRVSVLRRFTGGGAVYQDSGNLNSAISVPKYYSKTRASLPEASKVFVEGVVKGLKMLGVNAEFRPPGSILTSGKKISGIAGALRWGANFYHGTLLVNSDLNILYEVVNVRSKLKGRHVQGIPMSVTNLQHELRKDIRMSEVKKSLKRGFEKVHGISLRKGRLSSKERKIALQLYRKKYSLCYWNLRHL